MKLIRHVMLAAAGGILACDEGPDAANLTVTFENLAPLDETTEGTHEGWVLDGSGTPLSTGKFHLSSDGSQSFTSPIPEPMMFVLTVEPPGDNDDAPSTQKLMGGPFVGGTADLSVHGVLAADENADFGASPGTHVLLTPTNGSGTSEDAGLWLLNPPAPGGSPTTAVSALPPLTEGWTYEGWIVYRAGTDDQVAISYGKYTPQEDGNLTGRVSDAAGPLSAAPDDMQAGPPFPGSDFVLENGSTVPGGLDVPFDFNGVDATQGDSEWMHVVTIEPSFDEGESSSRRAPVSDQAVRQRIRRWGSDGRSHDHAARSPADWHRNLGELIGKGDGGRPVPPVPLLPCPTASSL